jgi:hypothetical protein
VQIGNRYGLYAGLYLIALGLTAITGWWFPGTIIATGLPLVFWCLQARKYSGAIWAFVVLIVSPLMVYAGIKGLFDWQYYAPALLITVGLVLLASTLVQNRLARRG